MLSKGKINLILGLCLTSIVSVGFSSWVISQDSNPIDIHGNIEVDNVINSKEYIYLDTTKGDLDENGNPTGIECFKYTTSGYLSDEGVPVDTGHIKAYVVLDITNCKKIFAPTATLDVTLTLKYANNNASPLNIFQKHTDTNGGGYRELNYRLLSSDDQNLSEKYNVIENEATGMLSRMYATSIEFSDILSASDEKIEFIIDYSLFATTGNYFTKNIYTYLYGNDIKFALNISVKEKIKE